MAGILIDKKTSKTLDKHYYKIDGAGSYGGIKRLSKESGIPLKTTKKWLMTQDTYTLHKPIRLKFMRRKVLAYGIGELMQCDLIDMSKLAKFNDGIKYVLTAIDVFSKYAYAIPLKSKNSESMLKAFKELFKQCKMNISKIQSDFGREFHNKLVTNYFKQLNIHHYSSYSEHKASVVERFNRTLKSRLFRIFTHTNSYRYIDILKSVLKGYNSSKHRSTGYPPDKVTPELESTIFEKIYGYNAQIKYKFNVGDRVRISKVKQTFRKGYLPNWTDEVFTIYKRFPSIPPTYLLRDLKSTDVKGRFYEEELQKVFKESHDFWRVERVLKSRGTGANKEYYVKWKGFDRRHNSWVKNSWIK